MDRSALLLYCIQNTSVLSVKKLTPVLLFSVSSCTPILVLDLRPEWIDVRFYHFPKGCTKSRQLAASSSLLAKLHDFLHYPDNKPTKLEKGFSSALAGKNMEMGGCTIVPIRMVDALIVLLSGYLGDGQQNNQQVL